MSSFKDRLGVKGRKEKRQKGFSTKPKISGFVIVEFILILTAIIISFLYTTSQTFLIVLLCAFLSVQLLKVFTLIENKREKEEEKVEEE